jgi:hypothetical protein
LWRGWSDGPVSFFVISERKKPVLVEKDKEELTKI